MWAIYRFSPIFGSNVDGAALVSLYHSAHPSIAVGNPGPSSLPQPGDVMSFNEGGDIEGSAGHTAVVVSAPNSSGNFTIMSENWSETAGEETAHIDMTGAHDGHVQLTGSSFWNVAPFLELRPAVVNGDFVTCQGAVFRIAGGAPLHVSNWNDVADRRRRTPLPRRSSTRCRSTRPTARRWQSATRGRATARDTCSQRYRCRARPHCPWHGQAEPNG